MAKLTKLNVSVREKEEVLSVSFDVSVTKEGFFTTTLPVEAVEKIKSYGIPLPENRLGREGYFSAKTLEDLMKSIRDVLSECLSFEIIEEKPVIRYQIETQCTHSMNKAGEITPNPTYFWTGLDYDKGECNWLEGTRRMDALRTSPFGLQFYASPFLKVTGKYRTGRERIEYKKLEAEPGSNVDWLNSVTCIAPVNKWSEFKEVECNEMTAKFFVELIKSICRINERIKDYLEPESIIALAQKGFNALSH